MMSAAFDRESSRAGEGDIASFEGHGGLSGLEYNFLPGFDLDAVIHAADCDCLIGEDFQGFGVRLDGNRAIGSDTLKTPRVGKQAGGVAGYGSEGCACGAMQIAVAGPLQVLCCEHCGASRAGSPAVQRVVGAGLLHVFELQ